MRIGLMGGTFDPIHYGHLFIAEEARARCRLNEVIFVPAGSPAHREGKSANADPETRYLLTTLATQSNRHFRVSRLEIDRPGPSYTYDTLQHIRRENPAAELYYIVGADSINEVLTWYRGAELFEMCRFVAASRPGFSLQQARESLSREQLARIEFFEVPGLNIASRELRRRVREHLPIRYLTPDAVEQHVLSHSLYQ